MQWHGSFSPLVISPSFSSSSISLNKSSGVSILIMNTLFRVLFLFAFLCGGHLFAATYSWSGPTGIPGDPFPVEGTLTAVVTRISSGQFTLTVTGSVTRDGNPAGGRVDIVQPANPSYSSSTGPGGTVTRDIISSTFDINFVYVGGSQYTVKSITGIPFPLEGDESQTITVSPTSGTVNKGSPFQFTVSGHHTSLVYSIAGITVSPPYLQATFDEIGIYPFTVYAEAGEGYSKSNTVTITVTVRGYRIKVPLPANTGSYMMFYDVSQGGVLIGSLVQLKGQAARVAPFDLPAAGPATITPRMVGVSTDGVIWSNDSGGQTTFAPTIVTPTLVTDEGDTVPESDLPPPSAPSVSNTPDDQKGVWSAADADGLAAKDKTIKEGTDKLVSSLAAINSTLKQINAKPNTVTVVGGTTDVSGINSRLDTVNENLEKMLGDPDGIAAENAMVGDYATGVFGEANDEASDGADDAKDALLGAQLAGSGSNPIPNRSSSSLTFAIQPPAGISFKKNFTFDLNPMTSPMIPAWLHSALSWVKAIIAFTAVGMLWVDTSKKTRQAILGVLQVNRDGDTVVERAAFAYLQSVGSSAFGLGNLGTWAGFLGVIGARFVWFLFLSGAFVAIVPGMVAILENVIFDDFSTYRDALATLSNQGGQFGQLVGMVLNLAPIYTLVSCLLFRIASETLISAGIIPLAVALRLIKI